MQLVLDVPAQRGDRALHDAVEQPALQVRQQRRRHVDRHDDQQHPPERGEVDARAGHDVLRLDQGRRGVVSGGARVGRRLGRRDAGGQPAADHAGEDDVRRAAEDHRADDVERDAGDAEDEHDDHTEPLGRQAAQQPARGRAERRGLLRGHPDARPRRPATGTALCGHPARGARGLVRTRRRGLTRRGRCGGGAVAVGGAHAATSALSWDSTISAYVGHVASSSSCVPRPTTVPVVQHDDLVRVGDRRDPLRDDHHGRLRRDGRERGPQPRVGGEVQRGERVVEQVDLGAAHQGAGDRQPLALPAGDVGAALRDRRVQPCRHRPHEVGGLRDLQRRPQLVVGGVRVLPYRRLRRDRAGEQVRPLRHVARCAPQLLRVELAHVDPVHGDRSRGDVEQPRHQRQQRGLARAGAADDRGGGAGARREGDPVQHRRVRTRVAELDPVEHQQPVATASRSRAPPGERPTTACRAPRRCARRTPRPAGSSSP